MNVKADQLSNRKYQTIVTLEETTTGGTCYLASHPELPGCVSQGDTPQEAVENLKEATLMVIEHLIAHNLPVPDPRPLAKRHEATQSLAFGVEHELVTQAPSIEPILLDSRVPPKLPAANL